MNKLHENVYTYTIYITYLLYGLAIFGITNYAPAYLDILKNIIKIYVSFILIIKFNPFSKASKYMSDFDRKIVFSSGVFLFLSTSIISIIEYYFIGIVKYTPINKYIDIHNSKLFL